MESQTDSIAFGEAFVATGPAHGTSVLILCEHASNRIPACLNDLGLTRVELESHVAWDPGALGVANALRQKFSAALISGNVSRLVYDCNRPPEAESAVPMRSEVYDIPGNTGLGASERARRVEKVYDPFVRAVSDHVAKHQESLKLLLTIHSFTPVFNGKKRTVELGILHGRDDRFAKAMMRLQPTTPSRVTRLNEPYSATDGVTHSLELHGTANGLLNVMIEIRNDLIETPEQQEDMASYLAPWIQKTLGGLRESEGAP